MRARRRPGLVGVLGLLSNLLLSAALIVGLDMRLGGGVTRWLLSVVPGVGRAPPDPSAPLWAALTLGLLLGLGVSVPTASRALFLDRTLPVLLASPVRSRRLLWSRVRETFLGSVRFLAPVLAAVVWLVGREAGWSGREPAAIADLLAAALAGSLAVPAASTLAGVLLSLALAASERRHPALGRLLSLPLALLPLAAGIALVACGRLGPGSVAAVPASIGAGAAGLGLLGATAWLGSRYRRLASSPPPGGRRAGRGAWAGAWLRGPVGAVVARDVSLAATNGLTWARVAIALGLGLAYPLVASRLGVAAAAGKALLPGGLGLPLAYTMLVWLLSLSEVLMGLGHADQAMSLTWSAGPPGPSRLRRAKTISGFVIGAPPALLTGMAVAAAGRLGPTDGVLLAIAVLTLTFGQAGLAASGASGGPGRRGSKEALAEGVKGAETVDSGASGQSLTAVGLLLEQVVITAPGLRAMGRMAAHLALALTLPRLIAAWGTGASWHAGAGGGVAVLMLLAALPGLTALLPAAPGGRPGRPQGPSRGARASSSSAGAASGTTTRRQRSRRPTG